MKQRTEVMFNFKKFSSTENEINKTRLNKKLASLLNYIANFPGKRSLLRRHDKPSYFSLGTRSIPNCHRAYKTLYEYMLVRLYTKLPTLRHH